MRNVFVLFVLIDIMFPAGTSAQQLATTPGFTRFDQQQFAKLQHLVGTWKCVDVPASKKPDLQTIKQTGNYFTTRETGNGPNTQYTRWSHSYKMYYTVEIDDSGGTQVYMTHGLDPFNSTWTVAFPERMPDGKPFNGKPFFPFTVTSSGNTIKSVGPYYDDKGVVRNGGSTCTKVS